MKITKVILSAAVVCGCLSAAHAQLYSGNIVGYYNLPLSPGTNYLANQFDNGNNNTLSTIFQPSALVEGTTFTEWNPATQAYLPTSTYDTTTGWSINYQLTLGQGGVLVDPPSLEIQTNTFTGSVWSGFIPNQPFVPPLVTGTGSMLLSCYIPINGATFYDVIGRDPQNGESVTLLDDASQVYTTTTFDGGAWNNGAPLLDVGQSAFFDLLPVATVPEPGVYGLVGAGALVLGMMRRRTRA